MASSDGSDSDDEMVSCQVCIIRFNQVVKKPKYLDCHHYFCMSCIHGFFKHNAIVCPTCRHVTNMVGRKIEDLATNNVVLRLLSLKTDQTRDSPDMPDPNVSHDTTPPASNASSAALKQKWCSDCSILATANCSKHKHHLCEYTQVLNENLAMIEGRAQKCSSEWDVAIEERQKIHKVYDDILTSLRFLQSDIMDRIDSNDCEIALMESKKQSSSDLASDPNGVVVGNIETDIGIVNTMKKINRTFTELDEWNNDASRNQFAARRMFENLAIVEENCVHVQFSSLRTDKEPLKSVELLKKLQLSYSGSSHSADSSVKAAVSVLSFLILRLAEEQSKRASRSVGGVDHFTHIELQRETIPAVRVPVKERTPSVCESTKSTSSSKDDVEIKKPNGNEPKSSFRDSVVRPPVNNADNWQTVSNKSPVKPLGINSGRKCYFIIDIDGHMQEKVVFQLEFNVAPIMTTKFKEMCSNKDGFGYQGFRFLRSVSKESVFGGPVRRSEMSNTFIADRSNVKEKRGSVRFQVKEASNGRAVVSSEFQILLTNRPSHHLCTSVFGYVVEGLAICEKISDMNLNKSYVFISECGVC